MREKSSVETALKWIVLIILGIAAIKIGLTVLGIAVALGGFLLFKVLPLVLAVWLVVALFRWATGPRGGPAEPADTI